MFLTKILAIRKIYPFDRSQSKWFRHNQYMQFAFLFRGRAARCFGLGVRSVHKALQYVKSGREVRQRYYASVWEDRLTAACVEHGLPTSRLLTEGLSQCNIALDRNMLQIMAIYEPRTFKSMVDLVKQYHLEKGVRVPSMPMPDNVITRGMLDSPVVPGNRKYYE